MTDPNSSLTSWRNRIDTLVKDLSPAEALELKRQAAIAGARHLLQVMPAPKRGSEVSRTDLAPVAHPRRKPSYPVLVTLVKFPAYPNIRMPAMFYIRDAMEEERAAAGEVGATNNGTLAELWDEPYAYNPEFDLANPRTVKKLMHRTDLFIGLIGAMAAAKNVEEYLPVPEEP